MYPIRAQELTSHLLRCPVKTFFYSKVKCSFILFNFTFILILYTITLDYTIFVKLESATDR